MMDFVATFQHWLTLACFVALAVCLFALAVLRAIPELTDAIRRFCGMDNLGKVVCGVCIVGAVLYGGSKGVNVRWDDGLRDNGTLITNDTVAVRWTYSGIPGASSVFIDYREAGSTNEWLNLAETLASAQEWTGTLANATNYDYWVYSTYVPPVPVHTNGVWVGQAYETKAKVGAAAFLILNGMVQEHGRTIATPAAKRRGLPYDSEVEYLQSSGTQYIDTGIYPNGGTDWELCMFTPRDVNQNAFGSRNVSSGMPAWGLIAHGAGSKWSIARLGSSWNTQFTREVGTVNVYAFRNGVATYNGEPKGTFSGNVQINYPVIMFGYNSGGKKDTTAVQGILYCKIWQDGVLVRDYISVRKDGVGYMYDKVSGQLFGNAGTGAFIVGPDK